MTRQRSLAELVPPGKQLTVSLAAAAAAFHGLEAFANPQEHVFVMDAIEKAGLLPPQGSGAHIPRKDDRSGTERKSFFSGETVRIFTDYEVLRGFLLDQDTTSPTCPFVLTDRREEADLLFLVTHVKDFLGIPIHQRVNQFPFEGCLVRKVQLHQIKFSSFVIGPASSHCEEDELPGWTTPILVASLF